MAKQEIIQRTAAATEASRSEIEALLAEVNGDSFDNYWANSASQSYCNAVKSGNVSVRRV